MPLVAVLLGVELLDELLSGVPVAGSPMIQETFATSYATTAWVLLLVPSVIALVVEPILFLAADRWPRRWFVRGGLFGLAVFTLAAAAAPTPLALSIALSGLFIAAGTGVSLAQATLVDLNPDARERVMTRWVMMGLAGDLLGPALLAGLFAIGLGWRAAFVVVAAIVAIWSLGTLQPFPEAQTEEDEEEHPGLVAALLEALRDRKLVLWLGATALCDLLDEILVLFGSLHLRDNMGAGPTERAIVLAASVVGGAVGVLHSERMLARHPPLRVLAWYAAASAVTYVAWLFAPTWWLSTVGMFLVGAASSPLYPIAQAQCYAALPGRSGTVHAASHLFTPIGLLLPWLLGLLADHAGTMAALVVLLAEPLGIALIASLFVRRDAGRAAPGYRGRSDSGPGASPSGSRPQSPPH